MYTSGKLDIIIDKKKQFNAMYESKILLCDIGALYFMQLF